jgi:ParB/RepB/Spo0J family partition protein
MKNESHEVAAVYVDPAVLVPWDRNPRNNEHAVSKVAESITAYGFASPIVARKSDNRVIAGHTRLKAAQQLDLKQVPVRYVDLTDDQASALAIADNKLGEIATWNEDELSAILNDLNEAGADLDALGWQEGELNEIMENLEPELYTTKIESPVYEITGDCPNEDDIYDQSKTDKLLSDIKNTEMDEGTREFLTAAASRHTVFRYDQIAEYYAHATPQVQRLMEDSALIIVDFEKAIEMGFVKLTDELVDLYTSERSNAGTSIVARSETMEKT